MAIAKGSVPTTTRTKPTITIQRAPIVSGEATGNRATEQGADALRDDQQSGGEAAAAKHLLGIERNEQLRGVKDQA